MAKTQETAGLLEEDRRGRRAPQRNLGSSGGRAWKGGLGDRIRVARKLPQAVLKISSHNTGVSRVRARLHYISRQGTLSVETDEGVQLDGLEELDELVENWAVSFSERKNSRDAMSLVISVPAGTDKRATTDAARAFLTETFGENQEYVFAGHDDTDHFHIHVVVKARGRDGKALRASRRDPQLWRQGFAAQARAHGIALDASPRTARGAGRRTPPRSLTVMRERDEVPRVDDLAAEQALRRALSPKDRSSESERVIRRINVRERMAFAEQALVVLEEAKTLREDKQRLGALEIAAELASFASNMPVPRSQMETMKAALKPDVPLSKVNLKDVHRLVKLAERGLRDQVGGFGSRADQRRAIAARAGLSKVIELSEPTRCRSRNQSRDIDR